MIVKRQVHKINADAPDIPNNNYMAKRIGFWALVIEQNSINNTVTVVSDTGFQYDNIPVISGEWVTVDQDKDYIPSQRNLPPKNSRVFVLTPTYSAAGAFVLCSGFSRGDENIRTLWAANDNELEDKNNSRETITQGGWHKKEEYANGNYSVISNDENIKFNVNTTEDEDKEQPKEVSVTAWGNTIIINEDGLTVIDKDGNTIVSGLDSDDKKFLKLEVADKDEESGVITTSASILLNSDKITSKVGGNSGTTIVQSASSVKINDHLEVTV